MRYQSLALIIISCCMVLIISGCMPEMYLNDFLHENPQDSPSVAIYSTLNGRILQKSPNGPLYWIDRGQRRRVESVEILTRLFTKINIESYPDLDIIPEGKPITDKNVLVTCDNETVFLLDNCKKRLVDAGFATFVANSFNWSQAVLTECVLLECIPDGESIKTGIQEGEQNTNTIIEQSNEDLLIEEIRKKGKGTLLLLIDQNHIYPVEAVSTQIMESFPLQTAVFDYRTQKTLIVPLHTLLMPTQIDNKNYIMEVFALSTWHQMAQFQWDGEAFLAKFQSTSEWVRYLPQQIRFSIFQ